jgi:hypothetical protein
MLSAVITTEALRIYSNPQRRINSYATPFYREVLAAQNIIISFSLSLAIRARLLVRAVIELCPYARGICII